MPGIKFVTTLRQNDDSHFESISTNGREDVLYLMNDVKWLQICFQAWTIFSPDDLSVLIWH